jgi:hypothetical protein
MQLNQDQHSEDGSGFRGQIYADPEPKHRIKWQQSTMISKNTVATFFLFLSVTCISGIFLTFSFAAHQLDHDLLFNSYVKYEELNNLTIS